MAEKEKNQDHAPHDAPAKVAPRFHAAPALKPAAGGQPALGPDPVAETAGKALEKLRENWQMIVAGALLMTVIVLFVVWRLESGRARDARAWHELSKASAGEGGSGKLAELADTFRGSSAEPFILLKLGDQLYEAGGKENIHKAIEAYERVLADHGDNAEASYLARASVEAAKRSLDFDPSKHAAEKGAKVEWARGEPTTTTPSATPSAPAPSTSPSK